MVSKEEGYCSFSDISLSVPFLLSTNYKQFPIVPYVICLYSSSIWQWYKILGRNGLLGQIAIRESCTAAFHQIIFWQVGGWHFEFHACRNDDILFNSTLRNMLSYFLSYSRNSAEGISSSYLPKVFERKQKVRELYSPPGWPWSNIERNIQRKLQMNHTPK